MNTFRATSALSKPKSGEKVPSTALSYLRTRNRLRLFTIVQQEFAKSGLQQVELAKRMGKGTDRICKILGAPGNWTLDTVSDLLFAMSGAELKYEIVYPLDQPQRNLREPEWLHADWVAGTQDAKVRTVRTRTGADEITTAEWQMQ